MSGFHILEQWMVGSCAGGWGRVTMLVLEPSPAGPWAPCSFVRECQDELVVPGQRANEGMLAAGGGNRNRSRPRSGLSLSPTASSSQKLLPVHFRTDSLLKGDAGRRAWQASVCHKEGRRCVFQREIGRKILFCLLR